MIGGERNDEGLREIVDISTVLKKRGYCRSLGRTTADPWVVTQRWKSLGT